MIAVYPKSAERPCEEPELLQALCDRIAAEHAARSEDEAAAITRAAIRRWHERDLIAARSRRIRLARAAGSAIPDIAHSTRE